MTAYYPSQSGYGGGVVQQPMYSTSGYAPTGYGQSVYGQPAGGVMYVPSSTHSYPSYGDYRYNPGGRRRSRRYHQGLAQVPYVSSSYYSGVPQMATAGVPIMVQPSAAGYPQGFNRHNLTFGQRMRLFFGLAPTPAFKYRSEKNSWGFMGFSRRQRFVDPRTGGEVDRNGRPVIRV